jgi:hypothetical protein
MPPPAQPVETSGTVRWADVEQRIGTPLPDDYKQFVDEYGTGAVAGFLWIFNPFSSHRYVNLLEQVPAELDSLRRLENEELPFSLFPQIGGILPFGATDNGNILFWRTRGTPNNWSIVIFQARGPKFQEFRTSLTSLLAQLLMRRIRCEVLPADFPLSVSRFVQPKV